MSNSKKSARLDCEEQNRRLRRGSISDRPDRPKPWVGQDKLGIFISEAKRNTEMVLLREHRE